MNRRQFLHGTAAVAALAALPRLEAASSEPLVGSQLYGWGQYYQRNAKQLADYLDEVFSKVRDLSYDYAETSIIVAHRQQYLALLPLHDNLFSPSPLLLRND